MKDTTKRRTGRTTAMLQRAVDAAKGGMTVAVVGANMEHAKQLLVSASCLCPEDTEPHMTSLSIKFKAGNKMLFCTYDQMKSHFLAGLPVEGVFIDHYVYESRR